MHFASVCQWWCGDLFFLQNFFASGVSNGVRWLGAPVPKNGVLANLRSHQLFRCQISGLDCTARRPVCNLQFKVCNLLATPGFSFIATLPLLIQGVSKKSEFSENQLWQI